MWATTSLSLTSPVITFLSVLLCLLTISQLLTHGEFRDEKAPSSLSASAQGCLGADVLATHAGITMPWTKGLSHGHMWYVVAAEGIIEKEQRQGVRCMQPMADCAAWGRSSTARPCRGQQKGETV